MKVTLLPIAVDTLVETIDGMRHYAKEMDDVSRAARLDALVDLLETASEITLTIGVHPTYQQDAREVLEHCDWIGTEVPR